MMKISIIVITLALLTIMPNVLSQELQDGTITSNAFFNEVLKNYADENAMPFDTSSPDIDVTVPIAVFLLRDSNGNEFLDEEFIHQSIINASNYMKACGIKLSMSSFNIIGDYNYSYINYKKIPVELLKKHKQTGAINLYLVDEILNEKIPYYGFTYYPTDSTKNYIFITKSAFKASNLATQLGHFFGLLSTHESTNTFGLADNSDCSTTGDLICDTWADPDLFGQVNKKCNYIGYAQDANLQYFIPSVANFMSNSRADCKCMFTVQQYRRMQYYYKKYRERYFSKM